MVEEYEFDATNATFMDTNRNLDINIHCDVVNVLEAGWVFGKISSHTLTIPVVVGRNNNYFLAQLG